MYIRLLDIHIHIQGIWTNYLILHHSLFIDTMKFTIIFIGSCYLLFVSCMTIIIYSIQKIQTLEPWLLAPKEYWVLMIPPFQSLRILLISSTAAVNSSSLYPLRVHWHSCDKQPLCKVLLSSLQGFLWRLGILLSSSLSPGAAQKCGRVISFRNNPHPIMNGSSMTVFAQSCLGDI